MLMSASKALLHSSLLLHPARIKILYYIYLTLFPHLLCFAKSSNLFVCLSERFSIPSILCRSQLFSPLFVTNILIFFIHILVFVTNILIFVKTILIFVTIIYNVVTTLGICYNFPSLFDRGFPWECEPSIVIIRAISATNINIRTKYWTNSTKYPNIKQNVLMQILLIFLKNQIPKTQMFNGSGQIYPLYVVQPNTQICQIVGCWNSRLKYLTPNPK